MTEGNLHDANLTKRVNRLLVLSTLRPGPAHGYQIALEVTRSSGGAFELQHGTLYPILHQLEKEGLVVGGWDAEGGRRRKTYRLTDEGEAHLKGETGRVESMFETLMATLRGLQNAPA